ncbi:MAG: malonyl-ACP O-methyltransferase BioC [Victivallaceae bacterium]|nr:malonyl-ACP O-methyltransferase BioC [Victivallaceae bacterium]MDD4180219.1 malonyl-ACP O-methyltransferase BioC [Victivallaceae bacterium]
MRIKLDKKLVSGRFAKSLETYDENAIVQRDMALELTRALKEKVGVDFSRIFEVGCGTGMLTRYIAQDFKYEKLIVNDLVPEYMVPIMEMVTCDFMAGDVETLPSMPRELDLIISNATFQWMENMERVLRRLAEKLKVGGILAFSTFGVDNIKEIGELLGITLRYLGADDIRQALGYCYDELYFSESRRELKFADPQMLLRHLQKTGVTGIRKDIWTKSSMQKFMDDYMERYGDADGVKLTYHPMLFIARKTEKR